MRSLLLTTVVLLLAACKGKCEDLVDDASACFDDICNSASHPFCECWDQGMDLSLEDCDTCVPLQLEATCDVLDMSEYEPGTFNCQAAEDTMWSMCQSGT